MDTIDRQPFISYRESNLEDSCAESPLRGNGFASNGFSVNPHRQKRKHISASGAKISWKYITLPHI